MSTHTKAVYDALRDGKKHTTAKAVEASGLSEDDFNAEVARLERDYWVESDGNKLSLTDKGASHLAQLHG